MPDGPPARRGGVGPTQVRHSPDRRPVPSASTSPRAVPRREAPPGRCLKWRVLGLGAAPSLSGEEKKPAPAGAAKGAAPAPKAALRVALVPKGTTHEFWKSIHAGANKAAMELGGVEV